MNCYENTFITKQDVPETQGKKLLNKYENIIKKNSGKVLKTEEWGLRILSHIIKKSKKGPKLANVEKIISIHIKTNTIYKDFMID